MADSEGFSTRERLVRRNTQIATPHLRQIAQSDALARKLSRNLRQLERHIRDFSMTIPALPLAWGLAGHCPSRRQVYNCRTGQELPPSQTGKETSWPERQRLRLQNTITSTVPLAGMSKFSTTDTLIICTTGACAIRKTAVRQSIRLQSAKAIPRPARPRTTAAATRRGMFMAQAAAMRRFPTAITSITWWLDICIIRTAIIATITARSL